MACTLYMLSFELVTLCSRYVMSIQVHCYRILIYKVMNCPCRCPLPKGSLSGPSPICSCLMCLLVDASTRSASRIFVASHIYRSMTCRPTIRRLSFRDPSLRNKRNKTVLTLSSETDKHGLTNDRDEAIKTEFVRQASRWACRRRGRGRGDGRCAGGVPSSERTCKHDSVVRKVVADRLEGMEDGGRDEVTVKGPTAVVSLKMELIIWMQWKSSRNKITLGTQTTGVRGSIPPRKFNVI